RASKKPTTHRRRSRHPGPAYCPPPADSKGQVMGRQCALAVIENAAHHHKESQNESHRRWPAVAGSRPGWTRGEHMSEAASVPFSETKVPQPAERLNRGALGLVDISASTMANIGPAYSFYFGFGFLVFTAGVAAPLTIIAAVIAVALLGNTLAQFSRAHPSTGGFISFVGKTFGGTSAVTTALLCGIGYIIAISSVLAVSGGFVSDVLQYYFN